MNCFAFNAQVPIGIGMAGKGMSPITTMQRETTQEQSLTHFEMLFFFIVIDRVGLIVQME